MKQQQLKIICSSRHQCHHSPGRHVKCMKMSSKLHILYVSICFTSLCQYTIGVVGGIYLLRSRSYPSRLWHTKSAFFLYAFLSPSLDKKRDQTESSNSEGENKGKDNRLLGPSNPENKTRAGRVSTCCKMELGVLFCFSGCQRSNLIR